MVSVEKLLGDVLADGEAVSFSTQGIPLKGRFPVAISRDDPAVLQALKDQVVQAWRQGWCEYHETVKSRGRPPVRAAYSIRIEFSGIRIKTDCLHKFFTLLLTRTKSTRYGRFLVVATNQSPEAAAVSIVLHPVALDGRMIRLEKDFPREFHRRVEMAFHSDPDRVVKVWLSS